MKKLSYFSRVTGKKGEINKLRREGGIPGVLYGHNVPVKPISIKKEEFDAVLRNMRSGLLATTLFALHDGHKAHKALIKEVQYHRSTYAVEHIDFILISEQVPVTVNVPIQLAGITDCVGVKLGGFVRQVIRSLKVSCLPKDLPQEFILDVRELGVAQSMRLSDVQVPEAVRPIAKMNEVAVVIAKKA
ncbi:MAG: 50S ribosomal protein L25 [Chlamydiia bacterium]|nr:50S ribosomal protein L25 [Chlamydiia bacterium]